MTRAVIYTRQSMDRDGTGLAVGRQLAECEALCAARGWTITGRESDNDMSASSGKRRPGYERVLQLMRDGAADVVVTWAVDRLTRRLADLVALVDLCEQAGTRIVTVSGDLDLSTPAGRLVARILGSVAQGEVETKAARQQLANRQRAEAGLPRAGTPRPFGWRPDRLTPDPAEAAAVRDACGSLLAGGTVLGVVRDWQARGVATSQRPRGGGPHRWSPGAVRAILRSPRIAGLAVHRGEVTGRGQWQPLVAEETWRAVCAVLDGHAPPRRAPRTLLSGLALCTCGNLIRAAGSAKPGGRGRYRCHVHTRGDREGPHVLLRRDRCDEWVGELVIARMSRDDAVDLVAPRPRADVAGLADEAEAVRRRLARLGPLFAAGEISEQDLTGGRAAGEARLAEIAGQLQAAGQVPALARLAAAQSVRAEWESMDVSVQRSALAALMTVTIIPPGRGRYWDPELVIRCDWVSPPA